MATPDDVLRWQDLVDRLRCGPTPRGDRYEFCREVLAVAPGSDEAAQALRLLLEGAMADAQTSIADAQEVMRLLKAADRRELDLPKLLARA